MTLSFSKLNEIGNLYESIAASEQEQLGGDYIQELTASQQSTKTKSELNTANYEDNKRGGVAGSISRGLTSMFGSQKDIDKNKASDKASDARVRQAGAASVGKYYSSSDNKTYANHKDAKAAHDSRMKALAVQQGAGAGNTPPGGAGARPPGGNGPKVIPTKPAGSAMDQFAKANPKLAAASAERDRTRGTSATTNPLMKDMKSSLPAPASKPEATPGVGQRAAAMPSMGSSQFKPATTAQATNAAGSTSAAASGSLVPKSNKIASSLKPIDLKASYEYDAYDLVLEYLLSQGHVETVAEAHYVMMEMDAEIIGEIVETRMDPRGRPASGPMNVYRNPKGKPDQAHLDAVKSYDEKQNKKSPEQKKKELDAYIKRQRENK